MPSLISKLQIFEYNEDKWIWADIFLQTLRDHLLQTDKYKCIKRCNIMKEFNGHNGGVRLVGEKCALRLFSVLRYVFHHAEDMSICKEISKEIERRSFYNSNEDQDSVLHLYKKVSTSSFLTSHAVSHAEFDIQATTLHEEHKHYFDNNQWKNICIFEYQFSSIICSDATLEFSESLRRKWDFYHLCKSAAKLGKSLISINTAVIKNRIRRRQEAKKSKEVVIYSATGEHIPFLVEKNLSKITGLLFPEIISKIVVVDDTTSVVQNTFNIYVELCEDKEAPFKDITECLSRNLVNNHQTNCKQVFFLCSDSFVEYERPNGDFARFHMQDDVLEKKLSDRIVHVEKGINLFTEFGDEKCGHCFQTESVEALDLANFSIFKEWLLDVPLPLQIILESLIRPTTLTKSNNLKKTLEGKLNKLYGTYDILLNIYNKNYCGVFQEAQTSTLAMNYHSIKSVFAVTNAAGATTSLVAAEDNFKKQAMDDLCYFNTYRKKIPLTYESDAGLLTKGISLHDCYLVLMLDNLVRLTYHNDPNPGESRSGQLCTLPITIQGLPKDSSVISQWHNPQLCDGSDHCQCKATVPLQKENINTTLFELLDEESACLKKFQNLSQWNSVTVVQMLLEGEFDFLQSQLAIDDHLHTIQDSAQLPISFNTGSSEREFEQTTADTGEDNLDNLLSDAILEEIDTLELEFDTNILGNCSAVVVNEHETNEEIDMDISTLEESFQNMSIQNDDTFENTIPACTPETFGLQKYKPPPLITRHPPPAIGRDDDIHKLQEIFEDVTVKSGNRGEKILCGPDNKIGSNVIKLTKFSKYQHVLPEFPLLHLRKSKINTLFSAYKDAGLRHLMMFMRDDDRKEWKKLVSAEHIDIATRYVKRIAMSLRLAFLVAFMHQLPSEESYQLKEEIKKQNALVVHEKWDILFSAFMQKSANLNGTFALHADMMQHCEEVVAIALAERLGGSDGYNLLLASVKSSLKFQFLNGASSYAPFCTKLLLQHYECGIFYKCLKKCLFSTPIGNSKVNFACDTKREMDHKDALKGFRSGSNLTAIKCRMSLIDSLNEAQTDFSPPNNISDDQDDLGWRTSSTDIKYINLVTALVLRRGGLLLHENPVPCNVYTKEVKMLPLSILDSNCHQVGEFVIKRYLVKEQLFQLNSSDYPDIKEVTGPAELIRKVKVSTGITLKRSAVKVNLARKSRDINEDKRKKLVKREAQKADCLSSNMNMCQALVKPDCSKRKVMKSTGVQKALLKLIKAKSDEADLSNYVIIGTQLLPQRVSENTTAVTLEFAGVKFKTHAVTGVQYLKYVENSVIKSTLRTFPKVQFMALCEEKYTFTPDNFKAATRAQRSSTTIEGIAHLKTGDQIISPDTFCKTAVVATSEGKSLISTYLAAHASELQVAKEVTIDIDSELYMEGCACNEKISCTCKKYAVPIRCKFFKDSNAPIITKLNIKQSKGEAEMAQIDWLYEYLPYLSEGDNICSLVTSGDIDAVVIHLFSISRNWPRDTAGKFKHPVYVILQKPKKKYDMYNITEIITLLEITLKDENISAKVAIALCVGGNDFLPKYHGISHEKVLEIFLSTEHIRSNFLNFSNGNISLSQEEYINLVKCLYVPKKCIPVEMTYDEIRQRSIVVNKKTSMQQVRNPQLWMPPITASECMASLLELQIDYLLTAGIAHANLPDFMQKGCLKFIDGEVEYDFGPDVKADLSTVLQDTQVFKRKPTETPQKGQRKKRIMTTSTPVKQ